MKRFVVLIDTPSIKQYVFGTDALAEIRGASALLDRLNRIEWESVLRQQLSDVGQSAHGPQFVDKVYANGGSAQFLVGADDHIEVEKALQHLSQYCAEQTGHEIQLVWGIGEIDEGQPDWYRTALLRAFSQMRWKRLSGLPRRTVPTFPLAEECQSTSYLPAEEAFPWGGEVKIISAAAKRKYEEYGKALGVWTDFVRWLLKPEQGIRLDPRQVRCGTLEELGEYSAARSGYIGVIYADGNAMGRLVQELDSPEVAHAFSTLVDGCIRDACFQALREVLDQQIAQALRWHQAKGQLGEEGDHGASFQGETSNWLDTPKIPADILLLGGDDLVVVLPAEHALPFAIRVSELFQEFTYNGRQMLCASARQFFDSRLGERGLTISCGVAIGPARFPFYLLLNLAEELLASAKRGGSQDPEVGPYWTPSYIDFHIQAGSATQDLDLIRTEEYRIGTDHRRTLRPYRREQLAELLDAARELRAANIPRSKLHDLFEAALEPRPRLAEWKAKEIFVRLKESEKVQHRSVLWQQMCRLGEVPLPDFPWIARNGHRATVLADLIEACDTLIVDQSREES